MSRINKLMYSLLCGSQDKNLNFRDLQHILQYLGFQKRMRGDHFIYTHKGIEEKINIQPRGTLAKPYQVKQVRELVLKYKLRGFENV